MRVLYAKEVSCPTCRASLSAIPVGGLAGIPAGGLIYMGIEGNQLALAVGLCGFAVTLSIGHINGLSRVDILADCADRTCRPVQVSIY